MRDLLVKIPRMESVKPREIIYAQAAAINHLCNGRG